MILLCFTNLEIILKFCKFVEPMKTWTKEQQVITEDYLIKYLASMQANQEWINHTRQLLTINTIIVERISKRFKK